ncbi:TPA: hypothetical protein VCA25_000701 [Streptococcus suis]|nr:hypothetical protein [Streptococcus suis]
MKYLVYITLSYNEYKNKIFGQLKAWKNKGYEPVVFSIDSSDSNYQLLRIESSMDIKEIIFSASTKRQVFDYMGQYVQNNFDNQDNIIYIRRLGISLLYFGKYIKHYISKVLYEIPTYPIDTSISFLKWLSGGIEFLYFKYFVYPYVTAVPIFLQSKKGRMLEKFIPIHNSVEVIEQNVISKKNIGEDFAFIFIGNVQAWHGLDKFLDCFVSSNSNNSVLVFSSNTLVYVKLKEKYKYFSNIIFAGKVEISELSHLLQRYSNVIGIGGLNYESRGAELDTSLKNKDYAALGIPFIYKLEDESFINYRYGLQLKDVDFSHDLIDKITTWYRLIHHEKMSADIVEFAKNHLSYEEQIDRIIRKIQDK